MAVVFKYFDLGGFKIFGRGGVARIFAATNEIAIEDVPGIGYDEKWFNVDKAKTIESGENPSGHLPILYDGDFQLSEVNAIIRYLGRKNNAQQDAKTEAASDSVLDKVIPLRDAVITALLADDATKAKHKEDRVKQYKILDATIAKYASASGLISQTDKPTGGDVSVFAVAFDDAQLFGKPDGDYPALKKLLDNLSQNAAIKAWLEKKEYGANPLL
jgi:glutathione S-transferase